MAANGAVLTGRVTNHVNHEPIEGATVRIKSTDGGDTSGPDPDAADFSALTGKDGQYQIRGVPTGNYSVFADRTGFSRYYYGASYESGSLSATVKIAAGLDRPIDLEMLPEGSISGRVLTRDGKVVETTVTALRFSFVDGHRSLFPAGLTGTDAEGNFTIRPLEPGRYVVRADHTSQFITIEEGGASHRKKLAKTFFPNADDEETASPIVLSKERLTVDNIDIQLQSTPVFSVSGTVVGPAQSADARRVLALHTRSRDLIDSVHPLLTKVSPDGTFRFVDVPPGNYVIEPARLFVATTGFQDLAGNRDISVVDKDVDRVKVVLRSPIKIKGQVVLIDPDGEKSKATSASAPTVDPPQASRNTKAKLPPPPPGSKAQPETPDDAGSAEKPAPAAAPNEVAAVPGERAARSLSGISIQIVAVDRVAINAPRSMSGADGSFSFGWVPSDRCEVEVAGLPSDTHVSRVVFNGSPLNAAKEIDLSNVASGELTVELSRKAAQISGVAVDGSKSPVAATAVSLWRANASPGESAQFATTDTAGRFTFSNLAPGDYNLIAWTKIDGGLAQITQFCEAFKQHATSISLQEGALRSIQVSVIGSASEIEKQALKIR